MYIERFKISSYALSRSSYAVKEIYMAKKAL